MACLHCSRLQVSRLIHNMNVAEYGDEVSSDICDVNGLFQNVSNQLNPVCIRGLPSFKIMYT